MIRFILVFLLITSTLFAQQKTIFDVARSGTLEEIEGLYTENKNCIKEINEYGFSPLILACYKGNTEVAKFLIEKKSNLDYVSDEGTALMASVVRGKNELAKSLLENGANPNLTNLQGTTALMYATQFKNIELVKLLLQYKADKTIGNKDQKTAFEFAVFSNNDEIINLLK
jgi:uncharacterized protein